MNSKPSHKLLRLLATFCPDHLYEGIAGDLEEQFEIDSKVVGVQRANRRLFWNVLRFFRPEILLRNKLSSPLNQTIMIESYVKIAARNIMKRKMYSFINAFGLSIGIAFAILIYLFINDEREFDQFHTNRDLIYRVDMKTFVTWNSNPEKPFDEHCWVQLTLPEALKNDITGIKYVTPVPNSSAVLRYGDKVFSGENLLFVDHDFFEMFTFPLLAGDKAHLFRNKSEIVITPAIARKYFGDVDPIGKTMTIDFGIQEEVTVAAVIAEPPANSSLDFEILIPVQLRPGYNENIRQWDNQNAPIFFQVAAGTSIDSVRLKLDLLVQRYMGSRIKERIEKSAVAVPPGIKIIEYIPRSLNDIHLFKDVWFNRVSDPQYGLILGGVAMLVLLIACINYVSFALTQSTSRRTEVGIRKVVGAKKSQLIYQFTFESIFLALLSTVVAIVLAILFLPAFNQLTDKGIQLTLPSILHVAAFTSAIALLVGVLAGSYPAWFLSAFRPSVVLRGSRGTGVRAGFIRPLVVLQFACAAFLIVSSTIMFRQLEFILDKDLGFDKQQVVVIPMRPARDEKSNAVELFRSVLSRDRSIVSVAGANISLTWGYGRQGWRERNGDNHSAFIYQVDPYYLPTLDIKLLSGRNFEGGVAADSTAVIINESLAKEMGWKEPLDEYLNWQEDTVGRGSKVIGVVKDFNFQTLERTIEPMYLSMTANAPGSMLIRVQNGSTEKAVDAIQKAWKEIFPDKPFDYTFLDQDLARQYESHQRWMGIMKFSTALAILISCLGLFGLSGMNVVNRTKEIGIRKVMGAALVDVFVLLNTQYVMLALIAFAVAIPFSIYAMNLWLAQFKYAVAMGWETFAITMMLAVVISLITVSYHGIRAALINPADTLKHE